ncbi:MAG: OmpA family protein [Pseudomonadales bacterium]|nr:OmpA family protein [Pseudomonadales bacterium]
MSLNNMPKRQLLMAAALMLSASAPFASAEEASGFTITPGIGGTLFDGNRNLEDKFHWSLGAGYRFENPWALELDYTNISTELDSIGTDVDVDAWSLNALYHLSESQNVIPFVTFGAGEATYDLPGGDDEQTLINVGLGMKYLLSDNSALRASVKALRNLEGQETDMAINLGYQYTFGQVSKTSAPAPAPRVDGDGDKDGVPDSADQCPTTPAGESVDAKGCSNDDDKDGVINRLDQCPGTPAGIMVNNKGCGPDSDRDTVPDHRDACPDTFPPAKVDGSGCYVALEQTVRIRLQVEFDFDSSASREDHRPEVKRVADFMREYPLTKVLLEGHTDSFGAEAYNQRLSEQRAATIATMLVNDFNIARDRVSYVGYGESRPIASNDTEAGRQDNRRVVAQIEANTAK